MSPDAWVVAAAVVAVALLIPRILGGRKVAPDVVQKKLAEGAKVVDVRTLDEYRSGAYPGAVHIPVQELPQRMGELRKDEALVLYCASGGRSAAAAAMLQRAGFKDVTNAGGLRDMPR